MEVAFYGRGPEPLYTVMLVEDPRGSLGSPESLLDTLPTGVASRGQVTVDFTQAVTATEGGVEYVCVSGQGADAGLLDDVSLPGRGDRGTHVDGRGVARGAARDRQGGLPGSRVTRRWLSGRC